jgi:hypothetical protein
MFSARESKIRGVRLCSQAQVSRHKTEPNVREGMGSMSLLDQRCEQYYHTFEGQKESGLAKSESRAHLLITSRDAVASYGSARSRNTRC